MGQGVGLTKNCGGHTYKIVFPSTTNIYTPYSVSFIKQITLKHAYIQYLSYFTFCFIIDINRCLKRKIIYSQQHRGFTSNKKKTLIYLQLPAFAVFCFLNVKLFYTGINFFLLYFVH